MFNDQTTEPDQPGTAGETPAPDTVEWDINATEVATLGQQADNQIKNHVLAATTLGLVPLPLFDLALLIGNQLAMVHGLARLYGIPFDELRTRAIITSLLAGSAPVLTVVGLSSVVKLMPGIGTLFGSGSVAVGGGALTYAVGQVFVHHFEGGGNLVDIDIKGMRQLFKRKFKAGQTAATDAQAASAGNLDDAA